MIQWYIMCHFVCCLIWASIAASQSRKSVSRKIKVDKLFMSLEEANTRTRTTSEEEKWAAEWETEGKKAFFTIPPAQTFNFFDEYFEWTFGNVWWNYFSHILCKLLVVSPPKKINKKISKKSILEGNRFARIFGSTSVKGDEIGQYFTFRLLMEFQSGRICYVYENF